LLALNASPETVTPFDKLDINWGRTRAWSEGGPDSQVFLNVKGREPQGVIDPSDYETFRDDLKAKLEATTGPDGLPLGTLVFKPEEVYREVRGITPDLLVHFGALAWRSSVGIGDQTIHIQENHSGPDGCNQ